MKEKMSLPNYYRLICDAMVANGASSTTTQAILKFIRSEYKLNDVEMEVSKMAVKDHLDHGQTLGLFERDRISYWMSVDAQIKYADNDDYTSYPAPPDRPYIAERNTTASPGSVTVSNSRKSFERSGAPGRSKRLYCFCLTPEDGQFMIACDSCNEWFHGQCVGISPDQKQKTKLAEWQCPSCTFNPNAKPENKEAEVEFDSINDNNHNVVVLNVGKVVTDRRGFRSRQYCFPAGFISMRQTRGAHANEIMTFLCEIVDSGATHPLFRITRQSTVRGSDMVLPTRVFESSNIDKLVPQAIRGVPIDVEENTGAAFFGLEPLPASTELTKSTVIPIVESAVVVTAAAAAAATTTTALLLALLALLALLQLMKTTTMPLDKHRRATTTTPTNKRTSMIITALSCPLMTTTINL